MKTLLDIEKKYAPNTKLVLISLTYDLVQIQGLLWATDYAGPIYVLDNTKYSSNTGKAQKKLYKELKRNSVQKANKRVNYFGDYAMRQGQLIYVKDWKEDINQLDNDLSQINKKQ